MYFEYDLDKSALNFEKHGIDDDRFELESAYFDEKRYTVTGWIEGKIWTAVITYRDDIIRLISVRRARKEEIDIYEQKEDYYC